MTIDDGATRTGGMTAEPPPAETTRTKPAPAGPARAESTTATEPPRAKPSRPRRPRLREKVCEYRKPERILEWIKDQWQGERTVILTAPTGRRHSWSPGRAEPAKGRPCPFTIADDGGIRMNPGGGEIRITERWTLTARTSRPTGTESAKRRAKPTHKTRAQRRRATRRTR